MITSLEIKNFKAWRDTGKVRLAPITVLFGGNSAGKTSLLQFLLMLKQTAESPDRRRVFNLGDSYSPTELGTFQDLIFEHEMKNRLEFEISWSTPQRLHLSDPITDKTYIGDALDFAAVISSKGDSQSVESFEYRLRREGYLEAKAGLLRNPPNKGGYSLTHHNYTPKRIQGRAWPLPDPTRFYGFPDEVPAYYQNASSITELVLALEQQLKRIMYLGPLRELPHRNYTWAGDSPEHVGTDGREAVAALLAAADRTISRGPKKKAQPFQEVIARWLKQLGLLESFSAKKIAKNRKEYEVRVRAMNSSKEVDLPDVGFGISQVLPVIVQSFYVDEHSTVIMEQPELHLHPRVQSELADMFIEAVQSREDGADRAVQFIIESHSEHFLQRLQRRVAEGVIKPRDIAMYFCEAGRNGSSIRELVVNEFGEIDNWPTNFFGDPMADLYQRMEAASQKEAQSQAK